MPASRRRSDPSARNSGPTPAKRLEGARSRNRFLSPNSTDDDDVDVDVDDAKKIRSSDGLFLEVRKSKPWHDHKNDHEFMVEKALFPLIYDKIPSIFSVATFTDYIPTFLGPKAFFNPKESVQLLFGYGWIAIIIYQFYTVLSFLRQYYILGDINSEVKGLSFNHRIFIYVSYLLLDLIYPISFVLLLYFYRTGILTRTEQSLRRDCDDSRQFESNQAGIARIYLMGFTYLFFHCVLLTIWLYPVLGNTWNLQLRFWVIDFGIPHALNPILLQCHISHIVLVFNARIELFRKDICNGHFECKDDLWHTYRRCRNSINRLSECLKYILGFFCLSLALAILLQGIAVFIFQGDIGSLTYMVLNIFVLLSVMYESQTLAKTFSDMCEDIIHLPADSVLGTMGSEVRQAFMVVLKRTDLYPSLSAFGIFQFSMENFYNAFILSLGSVASVLWNNLQDQILKNTAGTSTQTTMT